MHSTDFNPRTPKDATMALNVMPWFFKILIHTPEKDATAKSYKIGSDFAALFRKFIQKLGIVVFRISIF